MNSGPARRRHPSWATLVLLGGGFFLLRAACVSNMGNTAAPVEVVQQGVAAPGLAGAGESPMVELARHAPIELLGIALERCALEVRDYNCVFLRQELIDGKLTAQQAMRVHYLDDPRSVHMTWIRNVDRVSRAVYVEGQHVGEDGTELALVEPAGDIARLLVPELKVPVHGEAARRSSRHTIDQFGFRAVLERIINDNRRFAEQGVLDCRFAGQGAVEGRPTYVIVRRLPYTGPEGEYPDARQVLHLDQEWLLPVAIYSYADEEERVLLGSYVTIGVELNPGLDDAVFCLRSWSGRGS